MADRIIETYTGGYFQTNGYAIPFAEGSNKIILIDAPEGIADWVATRGWEVSALLLTHLHYDHVIDVAAIRDAFPEALIASHSQPDADLTLETVLKETIGWAFNVKPFSVDQTLAGDSEIEIAGTSIQILHVPGHSPDSLGFFFAPESRFFGGDILFAGGIGRTDFPHGNHDLLLGGIREKVYALPEETTVYPGHGQTTTIGEEKTSNPFV